MNKIKRLFCICLYLCFFSGAIHADCDLVIALNEIDISTLDKAKVLQALYEHAEPLGLRIYHYVPGSLTYRAAQRLLQRQSDFDYLYGRLLKIDLSGNTINTFLYNQDNGENAAEKAICEFFHHSAHYPSVHISLDGASARP